MSDTAGTGQQWDPHLRAVAVTLSRQLRDAVMRAPMDIDAAEAMEIPLLTALADAERRGMERAAERDAMETTHLDALMEQVEQERSHTIASTRIATIRLAKIVADHGPALVAMVKRFCSIETKEDWERLVMEADVLITTMEADVLITTMEAP